MALDSRNSYSVFTVCNIAYLPKALVLANSLMCCDQKKLKVVLFDKKQEFCHPSEMIEIIWVEELGVPNWRQLAFMYDIIEFSTSLKAFIAEQLLEDYEKVIFLDPDTCLYSSVDPILKDLESNPILLTPHYTTPQPSTDGESDLAMMRFGSFNLGFFAVSHSKETFKFLRWWKQRCVDFCFMESQFGLSTDQKWVAIAPCLFESLKVSFNLGYNVAPWNTFERLISKDIQGAYQINNRFPLVFFHFSNFNAQDPQYLSKRASSEAGADYPVLQELANEYSSRLIEYSSKVDAVPYTFDKMSDGTCISPTLRRAYAAVRHELPIEHDPFDSVGPVGRFARKNYLIQTNGEIYRYPGLRDKQKYLTPLKLTYTALRVILWLVGPDKFYNLSKLFVYLSIYRLNRNLWKL